MRQRREATSQMQTMNKKMMQGRDAKVFMPSARLAPARYMATAERGAGPKLLEATPKHCLAANNLSCGMQARILLTWGR